VGTYVCSSPRHVGQSALFAIFSTQSNDFGMGLPILRQALAIFEQIIGDVLSLFIRESFMRFISNFGTNPLALLLKVYFDPEDS
jgi:hypothetical protein